MPYKQFLGYDKGEDGTPVINEEEADIIKLIYQLFLEEKLRLAFADIWISKAYHPPASKNGVRLR